MTREKAFTLLKKYLKSPNLIKHSLAAEAAMKGIYKHLHKDNFNSEDQETWGITGLLHDVDYELAMSRGDMTKHGLLTFDPSVVGAGKEINIPEDIAIGIQSHNSLTGVEPLTDMAWSIRCCDQLTGLIVAAALIHPEKKLAPLTPDFIENRMKEKSFARGAKREPILMCDEKLGVSLKEFIAITLQAMKNIHNELGL